MRGIPMEFVLFHFVGRAASSWLPRSQGAGLQTAALTGGHVIRLGTDVLV
jgi:hypothetical protein